MCDGAPVANSHISMSQFVQKHVRGERQRRRQHTPTFSQRNTLRHAGLWTEAQKVLQNCAKQIIPEHSWRIVHAPAANVDHVWRNNWRIWATLGPSLTNIGQPWSSVGPYQPSCCPDLVKFRGRRVTSPPQSIAPGSVSGVSLECARGCCLDASAALPRSNVRPQVHQCA